jgi:uncharacterized protein (DUF362 family)
MELATVAVKSVSDIKDYKSVHTGIGAMLENLTAGLKIPKRASILIKLNLCLLMGPETGATVDPRVARGIVEWLMGNYDLEKVILAEADATHLSAGMAFKALGWRKYFKEHKLNVEFCNLSEDRRIEVQSFAGRTIEMSEKYMNADILISLAKLKTHSLQKISCTMKNLFGAMSEKYKIRFHPDLTNTICEASSMIDGLIGMDGKGPTNGFPKVCKLLIGGTDMVATDHFCAKLMGFRPSGVPHLSKAIKLGLGNPKYNVIGESFEERSYKFRVMPFWEELFRKMIRNMRGMRSMKSMEE